MTNNLETPLIAVALNSEIYHHTIQNINVKSNYQYGERDLVHGCIQCTRSMTWSARMRRVKHRRISLKTLLNNDDTFGYAIKNTNQDSKVHAFALFLFLPVCYYLQYVAQEEYKRRASVVYSVHSELNNSSENQKFIASKMSAQPVYRIATKPSLLKQAKDGNWCRVI